MKPKSVRRSLRLFAFLLTVGLAATAMDVLVFFPRRPAPGKGDIHRVEIPEGIGRNGLADLLSNAGLCNSPGRLALWLRFSGDLKNVKAGTFDVSDNLTPMEIMAALAGRTSDKGIKVVIPEGFTLSRIAEALAEAEILDAAVFLAAATDEKLLKKFAIAGASFEGYLFPDTYYFDKEADPLTVLQTMIDNFKKHLKAAAIPTDKNLTRTVTLASIVQAEAKVEKEMPTIAGVYNNRLNSTDHPSHLLQADPTVSYGCEPHVHPRAASCNTFKGILGRKQLDDPANPYNTYKHPGLPPGPICSPGIQALLAAVHPKKVPFLYFVANAGKDGSHVFSITYDAHQKAVEALRAAGR
jgi:UPF0755 protein